MKQKINQNIITRTCQPYSKQLKEKKVIEKLNEIL